MNQHNQHGKKNVCLAGVIFGGLLIGLPSTALTDPVSQVNPCPRIFYQTPYNSRVTVPQGCQHNAITQQIGVPIVVPNPGSQTPPLTPPLPENRSQPIATVVPIDQKVNVKLKNNTNALISYQAIGYTERRILPGKKEIVLRNLPTPVTITLVRQDKGLVDVVPISNSEPGMLQVSLEGAKNLSDKQGVLRIQKDGKVFVN